MRAVIHQPYFIPWMGYFAKIVYADKFIVLDNVNFTKGSYIDRVQIINSSGDLLWIGLPIGQQFKNKCNKIYFSDLQQFKNIVKCFYSAYSKARYFRTYIKQIESILINAQQKSKNLTAINMYIIEQLIILLKLQKPSIIYSSQYDEIIDPTERLLMLLRENNCSSIIMGSGGSLEAHDILKLSKNDISIFFQDYYKFHPMYYQTRRQLIGFAKGLSIVDCIFNEGIEKTKKLLFDKNCIPKIYHKKIHYHENN